LLDTLRPVTTPELIELQLRPAGLLPRALALLLDFALRTGILLAAGTALGALGGFGNGLMLLLWFGLEWFYPVLFEVLGKGATPGKRALGLKVLHDDGTPIAWGPSLTRNLLRAVDFLPLFYLFGALSTLLHSEFRRLGDIVAGTLVVYAESSSGLPRIAEAEPIAPAAPLDRATQRALIGFAERANSLTEARCEEIASLMPPIEAQRSALGLPPAARLIGLANYLIGRRT
jgi:uncharacterized RDD family membrane protein YckC